MSSNRRIRLVGTHSKNNVVATSLGNEYPTIYALSNVELNDSQEILPFVIF